MSDRITVLDASALLALIKAEPGAEVVANCLPDAVLASVNFAEVLSKLCDDGWNPEDAQAAIESLGITVMAFDAELALLVAKLRPQTRSVGLSLGDRACLALGLRHKAQILTADAAWLRIADKIGVDIINIRQRSPI